MRLSIAVPIASLLGCLPVLAQSPVNENSADFRAEIRRIVREEVRAALKEALGKEPRGAKPQRKQGDDTIRWRVIESKEQGGDADHIVVRKLDSELHEIEDVMGKLEITLDTKDMQPRVLRLDDLGPDVSAAMKAHGDAHAFRFGGGKLVPMRDHSVQLEGKATGEKAASKQDAAKQDAAKQDARAIVGPSAAANGKNSCVVQVECRNGQVKVTCDGGECQAEECPAISCTGGTCVLSIECDENGHCKVESGSSSCGGEAAECCEKEEPGSEPEECCQGCTSCESGAGARPQPVHVKKAVEVEKATPKKPTKAKKAKAAVGIGVL
jgi:hypothetical protein